MGLVKAVDGVSFTINRGETLGLVGESGCGKSTTSLAVLRMQPVTAGRIVFEGQDITAQDRSSGTFRRRMQMVYQDPYGSLDPRMMVRDIVGEPLDRARPRPTAAPNTTSAWPRCWPRWACCPTWPIVIRTSSPAASASASASRARSRSSRAW